MRLSVDLDEPDRLILKLEGIGDRKHISVNGHEVRQASPPKNRSQVLKTSTRNSSASDSVMDRASPDDDQRCSPGKVRDLLKAGPLSAHLVSMRLGFRNTSKHAQALLKRMVDDGDLRTVAGSKAGTQYALEDGG